MGSDMEDALFYEQLCSADFKVTAIRSFNEQCDMFEKIVKLDPIRAKELFFKMLYTVLTLPDQTWTKRRKLLTRIYEYSKEIHEEYFFINFAVRKVPLGCQLRYELLSLIIADVNNRVHPSIIRMLSFAVTHQDLCSVITACVTKFRQMMNSGDSASEKAKFNFARNVFTTFSVALYAEDPKIRDRVLRNFFAVFLKQRVDPIRDATLHNILDGLLKLYTDSLHTSVESDSIQGTTTLSPADAAYNVSLCFHLITKKFDADIFKAADSWGIFSRHSDLAQRSLQYWLRHSQWDSSEFRVGLKRVIIIKAFSGDLGAASDINKALKEHKAERMAIPIYLKLLKLNQFDRVQRVATSMLSQLKDHLTVQEKVDITEHVINNIEKFTPAYLSNLLSFFTSLPKSFQAGIVDKFLEYPLGYRMLTGLYPPTDENLLAFNNDLDGLRETIEKLLQATGSQNDHQMASIKMVKEYYAEKLQVTDSDENEQLVTETIRREFSDVIVNSLSAFTLFNPDTPAEKVISNLNIVIKTILRVQDKRVVNEGCDLLQHALVRARLIDDMDFDATINGFLKEIVDIYTQPNVVCRPRALWGICMVLFRHLKGDRKVCWIYHFVKIWQTKREHEDVLIRWTKLMCAFTKNSVVDLQKQYCIIVQGIFDYTGFNYEVISLFGNLLSSIYNRVLPQEPIILPLHSFLATHGSLFYWSIHFIITADPDESIKGPFTSIVLSALRRLVVIKYELCDYLVKANLQKLIKRLEHELNDPDALYRDLVKDVIARMYPIDSCIVQGFERDPIWTPAVTKDIIRRQELLNESPIKPEKPAKSNDASHRPKMNSEFITDQAEAAANLLQEYAGTEYEMSALLRVALSEVPEAENVVGYFCAKTADPNGHFYYCDGISSLFKLFHSFANSHDYAAKAFAQWKLKWPEDYPDVEKCNQFCDALMLYNTVDIE